MQSTPTGVSISNNGGGSIFELFRFNAGSTTPVKLSGTLGSQSDVFEFKVSPNGLRVAYLADQDTDNVRELYVAAMDGSGISKINQPMIAAGDVVEFAWSPDSSQVV